MLAIDGINATPVLRTEASPLLRLGVEVAFRARHGHGIGSTVLRPAPQAIVFIRTVDSHRPPSLQCEVER